jgi:glutamine amidotransferase-like uncharacterized protein
MATLPQTGSRSTIVDNEQIGSLRVIKARFSDEKGKKAAQVQCRCGKIYAVLLGNLMRAKRMNRDMRCKKCYLEDERKSRNKNTWGYSGQTRDK